MAYVFGMLQMVCAFELMKKGQNAMSIVAVAVAVFIGLYTYME